MPPRRKKALRKYRPKDVFAVGRMFYRPDMIVSGDDPVLKGREHLFIELEYVDAEIEKATSAPGEKRVVNK